METSPNLISSPTRLRTSTPAAVTRNFNRIRSALAEGAPSPPLPNIYSEKFRSFRVQTFAESVHPYKLSWWITNGSFLHCININCAFVVEWGPVAVTHNTHLARVLLNYGICLISTLIQRNSLCPWHLIELLFAKFAGCSTWQLLVLLDTEYDIVSEFYSMSTNCTSSRRV